ncbi:MAG: cytochrome c oxidase accessory protein CcoG [Gammaproteobacteria bacterium]|nr:cytochrome c oxidase accessory protein CcoG [Gammaproteobacteria bacterium]MDH5629008.1 cytochrome c oxidase accessory protein CcoG [Gammaproteobacteria bacterium]
MFSSRTQSVAFKDLYAKQRKIYPRQVHGIYARLRVVSVLLLLGFYYLMPWVTWDGHQAILFDLPARKFHLFSLTLWPQDFILLALLLVFSAVSLFMFTAFAGRLWCGYACPQTVWTETFLWIEHLVEGNRNQRMKLDKKPWGLEKTTKKFIKHFLWITFALFTGYTFVGYFTPIKELWTGMLQLSLGPWEWFWIGLYSLATYGNAGKLREQVCLYMCPYARFQSAMFDKDTLIIAYDNDRGDPRGKRKKDVDPKEKGLGDCIDCNQCVHVCPTGIDIRDGLQYECIACAACVDVCDNVMMQMNYDKGLIRYTSENAEAGSPSPLFRTRTLMYLGLFSLLIGVLVYLIASRIPLDVTVIKDRVTLYSESFDGKIENTFQLKVLNMSQQQQTYDVSVQGLDNITVKGQVKITVDSGEIQTLALRLAVPAESLKKQSNTIYFVIKNVNIDDQTHSIRAKFIGPNK